MKIFKKIFDTSDKLNASLIATDVETNSDGKVTSYKTLDTKLTNFMLALGLATDDYDTTATYNTGDLVIYDNTIYKCNTDSTTGAWDSTKWDIVPIIVESEEDE